MKRDDCGGSGPHSEGELRRRPHGPGSDAADILCRACWRRENAYSAPDWAPQWEEGEVYEEV